jgi:hypothetical protein
MVDHRRTLITLNFRINGIHLYRALNFHFLVCRDCGVWCIPGFFPRYYYLLTLVTESKPGWSFLYSVSVK